MGQEISEYLQLNKLTDHWSNDNVNFLLLRNKHNISKYNY